jgi:hypothetical protein
MLSAIAIVNLQDELNSAWHHAEANGRAFIPLYKNLDKPEKQAGAAQPDNWLDLIARQHRSNFELWHIEDEARAPGATDAELAEVKRRVDRTNQLRNDLAEELDRALLAWLESQNLPNPDAPLNSESPGMIIDRLSILSLKIYHTREEAERPDAPAGHAQRNRDRLAILSKQRADLAGCLDQLWQEALSGARRFKIYLQLKMYNDPSLNPAIYGKLPRQTGH